MLNRNKTDDIRHLVMIGEGLFEVVLLVLVYYLAWMAYKSAINVWLFAFRGRIVLLGLYAILVCVVFVLCDSFNFGNLKIADLCISQSISLMIINFITYFQLCLIMNRMLSIIPLLLLTLVDFCIACGCAFLFTKIAQYLYVKEDILLIYGAYPENEIVEKFSSRSDKYSITKTISADVGNESLYSEIDKHSAVIIFGIEHGQRAGIIKYCYKNQIRLYAVPGTSDVIMKGSKNLTLFDTPLMLIDGKSLEIEQKVLKRALDLLLGLIASIPCILIIIIIGIMIKVEDGGAIFYKQRRLTYGDREFEMIKFRSMIENAERDTGAVLASENDERITKVGRFLRRHRLDEIPQIINILKGDMSIVGPRPERKEIADEIIKDLPEFAFRTKVKGGLTGYAQVYGKYNSTAYDKLKMDLMYIENPSFFVDLKMILMTPQILFRKESTEGIKNDKNTV